MRPGVVTKKKKNDPQKRIKERANKSMDFHACKCIN